MVSATATTSGFVLVGVACGRGVLVGADVPVGTAVGTGIVVDLGVTVGIAVGVGVDSGVGVGDAVAAGKISAATSLGTVVGSSAFEQPMPIAASRAKKPYIAFSLMPLRPLGHRRKSTTPKRRLRNYLIWRTGGASKVLAPGEGASLELSSKYSPGVLEETGLVSGIVDGGSDWRRKLLVSRSVDCRRDRPGLS